MFHLIKLIFFSSHLQDEIFQEKNNFFLYWIHFSRKIISESFLSIFWGLSWVILLCWVIYWELVWVLFWVKCPFNFFFKYSQTLHWKTLHCNTQHVTAIHCTALYCTTPYCTELYCITLLGMPQGISDSLTGSISAITTAVYISRE